MFDKTRKIIKYPRLTQDSPKRPVISDHFIGKPVVDDDICNGCGECMNRCPSGAIHMEKAKGVTGINYDECVFCMLCEEVCPLGAVRMTKDIYLAERDSASWEKIGDELRAKINKMFGRSLHIREVDSGSCNACDYEINALNNPFVDIERFGVHFVASPRHADMLLVTGAAVRNMEQALLKTYNAAPDPKLVVAVGACACSGGIFRDTYAAGNGIRRVVPVDVCIPGCPPRPQAILHGILKALDRDAEFMINLR
ncbi:MAG TPA: NADH-quinone oxidoreductase subunit NuoB [Bacillota bacterium]|nr:NADH-quinone oxidoreductase subunit NuoB [Bacillota bacterium]